MAKRQISEAEVQSVVENPDTTYPSRDNPQREVRVREIGARRIAVVVEERPGQAILVITAYDQLSEN